MKPSKGPDAAYAILLCIFSGSLTIASILATKIIHVFGLFVPAGVLAYAVTFAVTDVIGEIWGKKRAAEAVLGGFFALAVTFLLIRLAVAWPKAPFWTDDAAFVTVLHSTSRIIVASFIAYFVSQFHDIWAFHRIKRLTDGRHLWLRNIASTMVSQFIDSVVFIHIAFYGVLPVWPLVFGQWAVKTAVAFLDTPIVYLLVRVIGGRIDSGADSASSAARAK
jgi:hypothetical protein